MITEYDKIRDEHYMSTWNVRDIESELQKCRNSFNNKYEEYSKSDYYNAILEQRRINKKR